MTTEDLIDSAIKDLEEDLKDMELEEVDTTIFTKTEVEHLLLVLREVRGVDVNGDIDEGEIVQGDYYDPYECLGDDSNEM